MMELLKPVEVSGSLLRTSVWTIHRMIHQRQLPAFKVGSDWRINAEQLEQFMHSKPPTRKQAQITGGDK